MTIVRNVIVLFLLCLVSAAGATEPAAAGTPLPADGGEPGKVVSEGFVELRELMLELGERDIVLRDLDRGLIDFPSIRDGEEVYLCWLEGEDEIGFWHEPEAGFAGRRRLDDG